MEPLPCPLPSLGFQSHPRFSTPFSPRLPISPQAGTLPRPGNDSGLRRTHRADHTVVEAACLSRWPYPPVSGRVSDLCLQPPHGIPPWGPQRPGTQRVHDEVKVYPQMYHPPSPRKLLKRPTMWPGRRRSQGGLPASPLLKPAPAPVTLGTRGSSFVLTAPTTLTAPPQPHASTLTLIPAIPKVRPLEGAPVSRLPALLPPQCLSVSLPVRPPPPRPRLSQILQP